MCGGGCVSWFSRTQKCVTLSTTEAEYVALADVIKEVLFLRQVWRFMLPDVGMPCIPVLEDNEGAVQLAKNPVTNSNSKHIDRCTAPFSQGSSKAERDFDNPRDVFFSARRFLDQGNTTGVFGVSP